MFIKITSIFIQNPSHKNYQEELSSSFLFYIDTFNVIHKEIKTSIILYTKVKLNKDLRVEE